MPAPYFFRKMITVKLYQYTGYLNAVNKILPTPVEYDGYLYDGANILSPTIRIEAETLPTANYCFISELNRYYFIEKTDIEKNMYILHLSVDVLMTYAAEILQSTGTITERSDDADKYLSTRSTVYDLKPNFEKITFTNPFNSTGHIIMVAIRGV